MGSVAVLPNGEHFLYYLVSIDISKQILLNITSFLSMRNYGDNIKDHVTDMFVEMSKCQVGFNARTG